MSTEPDLASIMTGLPPSVAKALVETLSQRTAMATLEALAQQARDLANKLFSSEGELACSQIRDNRSCLMQEDERPLTRKEKQQGWAARPFWAYDPDKLCSACRAYWWAEQAAQELHRLHCFQRREEALRKARGE